MLFCCKVGLVAQKVIIAFIKSAAIKREHSSWPSKKQSYVDAVPPRSCVVDPPGEDGGCVGWDEGPLCALFSCVGFALSLKKALQVVAGYPADVHTAFVISSWWALCFLLKQHDGFSQIFPSKCQECFAEIRLRLALVCGGVSSCRGPGVGLHLPITAVGGLRGCGGGGLLFLWETFLE